MGKDDRTYLIKTTLLAGLSHWETHWVNLCLILSKICIYEVDRRDLRKIGIPIYLKVCHLSTNGN
jgi:hypothetical protein